MCSLGLENRCKGNSAPSKKSLVMDEDRTRPVHCVSSALSFLHGFGSLVGNQERHSVYEKPLSPQDFYQNNNNNNNSCLWWYRWYSTRRNTHQLTPVSIISHSLSTSFFYIAFSISISMRDGLFAPLQILFDWLLGMEPPLYTPYISLPSWYLFLHQMSLSSRPVLL